MINFALSPNWKGNTCNLQQYVPRYNQKVYQIRRKIIAGMMKIMLGYWIDFDWNMPPIHHIRTNKGPIL